MDDTIIDMHNWITAAELEKIVRHQLKLIFDKPEMAESLPPLMIWGAPGWENPGGLFPSKNCQYKIGSS